MWQYLLGLLLGYDWEVGWSLSHAFLFGQLDEFGLRTEGVLLPWIVLLQLPQILAMWAVWGGWLLVDCRILLLGCQGVPGRILGISLQIYLDWPLRVQRRLLGGHWPLVSEVERVDDGSIAHWCCGGDWRRLLRLHLFLDFDGHVVKVAELVVLHLLRTRSD